MLQHPDVDLVLICVRVPFHHQLGMAALNAGKHLYCEWPLAATTEQAQQMRDLAVRIGVHHMVGLQARGAPAFNLIRDLVAEGYVGKVLSCTMIITTPAWGTEFTLDWAYMADRSNGNTLMTSPGGHSIDALCYCLGEFKELSSVVANQRQRVKIVETGETIQMTAPDQVLSGVLQSGAAASVHLKGGTANGTGFLFEIHGTEGALAIVPADPRHATYVGHRDPPDSLATIVRPLDDLFAGSVEPWSGLRPDTPVTDVMRTGLPTLVPQMSLDRAFMMVGEANAPALPVVDNAGQLVGLFTTENVGELIMVQSALGKKSRRFHG
jgi:predicted dehydrogenase